MRHVLVIDDEKIISDALREALTRSGYQVKTASGGYEGLRLFDNGLFDLVITDICMPGMDGHAVARHIRNSDRPDTPIIGISGTPWLSEGNVFDRFLSKPFPLRALLDTVNTVMRPALSPQKDFYGEALPAH